jgi:hypothetical protein
MMQHEDEYNQFRRQECKGITTEMFHVDLPVDEFLCDDVETGTGSYATLFRSGKEVYALLVSQPSAMQTMADVQRILKGMGLTVDKYMPPYADPTYFYRQAAALIKRRYPARRRWTVEDLRYYSRQTAYSPALVRVVAIDGAVRRYNAAGKSWQDVMECSFRKVRVAYA